MFIGLPLLLVMLATRAPIAQESGASSGEAGIVGTPTGINIDDAHSKFDEQISGNAEGMIEEGRRIFRFDTFGNEAFWGKTLKLHKAIEGTKLGGVGAGVSPKTALAVGLKVDTEALPRRLSKPSSKDKWTWTIRRRH
jgi:hypothetical protein